MANLAETLTVSGKRVIITPIESIDTKNGNGSFSYINSLLSDESNGTIPDEILDGRISTYFGRLAVLWAITPNINSAEKFNIVEGLIEHQMHDNPEQSLTKEVVARLKTLEPPQAPSIEPDIVIYIQRGIQMLRDNQPIRRVGRRVRDAFSNTVHTLAKTYSVPDGEEFLPRRNNR